MRIRKWRSPARAKRSPPTTTSHQRHRPSNATEGRSNEAVSAPPATMWEPPERSRTAPPKEQQRTRTVGRLRGALLREAGCGTAPLKSHRSHKPRNARPKVEEFRGALSTPADQVGGAGAHADCGEASRSFAPRRRGAGPPPKELQHANDSAAELIKIAVGHAWLRSRIQASVPAFRLDASR